jgi:predicted nucleotidyltransferase
MPSKKNPVAIAEEFGSELRSVFGNDLQALLLVGSAARGDFVPGKSDVNTLIILTPDGMDWLEKAYPVIKKWRKKSLALPHFMMPSVITDALDSYPLEFLDFKTFHQVIIGPDVMSDIEIPLQPLRLQIERELRGKLFLLRQIFASEAGQPKNLKAVLGRAVSVFTAVFQGILELGRRPIPADRRQLFQDAAAFAGFSDKVFLHLLDVKEGKSDKNLRVIFKDLLKELTALVAWADAFELSK